MNNLQKYRKQAKLSQSALSEASGININTLRQYEQGTRDINGISILRADSLAKALGVSIEDLIERNE